MVVLLDTNIVIDHLRQPTGTDTLFEKMQRTIGPEHSALSMVSVQELYAGKGTLDSRNAELLLATIAPLSLLPYAYEVAELAGALMRDSKQSMAFAATAIVYDAELATLNVKDFRDIDGLTLYSQ